MPVPVRMHSLDVMEDVLGDKSGSRGGGELQERNVAHSRGRAWYCGD